MDGLSKISSTLVHSGFGSPYGMVRKASIVIAEGFKSYAQTRFVRNGFSSKDFIIQINTIFTITQIRRQCRHFRSYSCTNQLKAKCASSFNATDNTHVDNISKRSHFRQTA